MPIIQPQVSSSSNHELYMDNFFTSIPLLKQLRNQNLRTTGVIRDNRIRNAPLQPANMLKERGQYHSLCDGEVRLVRLCDSKVVTIATNFDNVEPLHFLSRKRKGGLEPTKLPHVFYNYNQYMGAVDYTNRYVSDYPIFLSGNKWYWSLFINCVALMRVAAWRLSAHINHGRPILDQLAFTRAIVQGMATTVGQNAPSFGPSGKPRVPCDKMHLQVPFCLSLNRVILLIMKCYPVFSFRSLPTNKDVVASAKRIVETNAWHAISCCITTARLNFMRQFPNCNAFL
jgi:hypothetical protein